MLGQVLERKQAFHEALSVLYAVARCAPVTSYLFLACIASTKASFVPIGRVGWLLLPLEDLIAQLSCLYK